jgi:murein DD-endopeptidase MepM/ murein hydrolase activator NlpD
MSFLTLTACFGIGRPSPADIQPVYKIKNSPIPVPDVRWNPRRAHTAPVARRTARATPVRAARPKPRPQARVAQTAPASGGITVAKGDTLYSLSRRYGVPVQSFVRANNLRSPYTLAIGQKLVVPSRLLHTVKKGETGYGISRLYGVNLAALMRENKIRRPYTLQVGQVLRLPGGARPAESAPARSQTTASAAPAKRGRIVAVAKPPARSSTGFSWPVDGKLASRYGPKEGGLHNDGINILASSGTSVRAAEAGVVVYASNALEGYGNLLLLRHADGWLTAYAHNERLLVNKGDQVKKGQVIARVGSTGGVTEPQLHFEIRKGRRALDPLDYLKQQTTSSR